MKSDTNLIDKDIFLKEIKSFKKFGAVTQTKTIDNIPYYVNEFWTSKQRQGHRIHEVSYRACFKPQLPGFFIKRLSREGDIVYDPFVGRGTTVIEATLQNRIAYGNDINPLSKALTEPRVNPPSMEEIDARMKEIPWNNFNSISFPDLKVFYHPHTLEKIEGLRDWLIKREQAGIIDNIDKWIRMVAINRLTGHSSGFFSVYTLPPNQAVSIERQLKINEKRNQTPDNRDVIAIILKKSKSLLSQGSLYSSANLFLTEESSHTPQIKTESVSLTITSPPFLDIVDYEADNWLRCWFLGIDPKTVKISKHRNLEDWKIFISSTLLELARITKPGGYIAFEVGEIRNGTIQLDQTVIEAAKDMPFDIIGVMINQQEFTKTSNCWGVSNNKNGTNSNRIVLFQKQ